MAEFQALLLIGIGVSAAGLIYHNYLRKASSKIEARSPVLVQVPVSAQEIAEKIIPPVEAEKRTRVKSKTPINAVCGKCKKGSMLPFRCKFCSQLFCGEHRLPENHDCEVL